MTKEDALKEVEIAFQVWELMKDLDYRCWHRVISITEQIRNDEQMKRDMAEKQAYAEKLSLAQLGSAIAHAPLPRF